MCFTSRRKAPSFGYFAAKFPKRMRVAIWDNPFWRDIRDVWYFNPQLQTMVGSVLFAIKKILLPLRVLQFERSCGKSGRHFQVGYGYQRKNHQSLFYGIKVFALRYVKDCNFTSRKCTLSFFCLVLLRLRYHNDTGAFLARLSNCLLG